ncbi:MAG: carboxypeptidase regulatory-like domain-containing protein [Desulfobacterium sp.]|nr:carboxypeptidase regulatory-like domain-containing protein [Desulfobacterium sp.]
MVSVFMLLSAGGDWTHALNLSGAITCENWDSSTGKVYISVTDAQTGEDVAQAEIANPGDFTLDLGNLFPASVVVVAFHDFNDSGGSLPDLGDSLAWCPGNPISLSGADVTGLQLSHSTTFGDLCGDSCPYEIHDAFSSQDGLIDAGSWNLSWGMLENYRYVKNGILKMGARPRTGSAYQRVRIDPDDRVNRFKADVKLTGCSMEPGSSDKAFARMNAYLYNSEAETPTGPKGDIWASFYLGDWGNGLEIAWQAYRINDNAWEEWELLSEGVIPVAAGLAFDTWYAMEIDISQPEKPVVFNFYNVAEALLASKILNDLPPKKGASYTTVSDIRVYVDDQKDLSHGPQYIFAEFDNVYVNGNLYDDFSTGGLDSGKWRSNEAASRIEDGQLLLLANARGAKETAELRMEKNLAHVAVDVTIDPASHVSTGAKGQFRLGSAFYNDERGPGSGQEYQGEQGLVWAKVFIDRLGDDTLRAGYYICRSNLPDPVNDEDWDILATGFFNGLSIQPNREYRLSINFTAREMVFRCQDRTTLQQEEFVYPITTPAFPCQVPYRTLASRVYADSGQDGYMIARCSAFYTGGTMDGDQDGITDFTEILNRSNPLDGDMDDDGIMDGNEDKDQDGVVDGSETDPKNRDTDGDGLLDGIEVGLNQPENPAHTDMGIFISDVHPGTITDPKAADTDRDGVSDGQEDANHNGRVDEGETDPNKGVSVSGRVTDNLGNPIAGLWMHAYETPCTDTWLGGDHTDANGYYTITGLPAGNVHVEACANCDNMSFVNEWWAGSETPGAFQCEGAQVIQIQVDQSRSDIHFQLEPAGFISGTVTDRNGTPLQGIHIQIKAEQCNWEKQWAGIDTDENGYYRAGGIPEGGQVYIYACSECNDMNYVREWYDYADGTRECGNAVPVVITAGEDLPPVNFVLEPGKIVSGTVRDQANTPIPDLWVSVHDWETDDYLGGVSTRSDGTYTVSGLPQPASGKFKIYLNSGETYFVGQSYALPVDPDATSIDFAPVRGGRLRGLISGNGGGVPHIWLNLSSEPCGQWVNGIGTNPDGRFSSNLPAGTYYLMAASAGNPDVNFIQKWWNLSGGSQDCSQAQSLVITEGQDRDIEMVLEQGGAISGTVTDPDGNPIPNCHVFVRSQACDGVQWSQTDTDENGNYTINGIPNEAVYINACPDCKKLNYVGEWYDGANGSADCATAIAVHSGENIDFVLEPKYLIFGSIQRSETNLSVADATIEVLSSSGHFLESATSDANGDYEVYVGSGSYFVRAFADGLAREYFDNVTPSSAATLVEVKADFAPVQIDFALTTGGVVRGTIMDDGGITPLADADIFLRPAQFFFDHGYHARTDLYGNYVIGSVPLGLYKLRAEAEGFAGLKYFGNSYGWGNAAPVVVEPPGETGGQDIQLDPEAVISGTIYDSEGLIPLEMNIIADTRTGRYEGIGDFSEDGDFTISRLPPGEYTLRIDNGGDQSQWYVGEWYDGAYFNDTAETITVDVGDHVNGVEFRLEQGGRISGQVVDDDTGDPIREVQIGCSSALTEQALHPSAPLVDEQGRFWLNAFPGSYKLNVFATHGYVPGYYAVSGQAYSFDQATPVTVKAFETSQIEIRLKKGGAISGLALDEDGVTPLVGASLYAFPVTQGMPGAGALSGIDGAYMIEGLPTGTYVVKAVTVGHAMQCREATVSAPDTTTEIDLILPAYPYEVITVQEVIVPPTGGYVSIQDDTSQLKGVEIVLSGGALSENTLISVCEIQSPVAPLPAAVNGMGVPLHLGPENLSFAAPVVLGIPYTDQDLFNAGITDPMDLDVFTLNLDTALWEKVTGIKHVDDVGKKIRIELEHFSIYQLGLEQSCTGDFEPDGDVDGKDLAEYLDRLINDVNIILQADFAENFGLSGGCN